MKKSLIALAVAAAVPALAQAQTNVTMFGIADAAVQYSAGKGNGNNLRLVSDGYNSSRWGVRGVEELGGGLKANFWLEAGLSTDSGNVSSGTNVNNQQNGSVNTAYSSANANAGAAAGGASSATATTPAGQTYIANSGGLTFNRRATVGLSGGFGELRLGRDYVPSFWNHTVYDAFGTNGAGSGSNITLNKAGSAAPTSVRASNSIGYFLPAGMPVFGQVMIALGENGSVAASGKKNDGRYVGARVGAAFGPAEVAVAAGQTKYVGGTAVSGFTGDFTDVNVGGKFAMGAITLMGLADQYKYKNGSKSSSFNFGMNWAVGAGTVRAAAQIGNVKDAAGAKIAEALQLSAGYVHDLSKRTAVYGTVSALDNRKTYALSGGTTYYNNGRDSKVVGGNTTALEFGLRHSF